MAANQTTDKAGGVCRIAAVVFLIATLPTIFFGLRIYGSFSLLQSAYDASAPMTSSIRGWMTLKYVTASYRISDAALLGQLGLPSGTDPNTSLKTLADRAGVTPSIFTQRVQRAIAALSPELRSDRSNSDAGWLGTTGDDVLTALLVYGYPALGLTLLLGAIGLPLPDGVVTTIASSLASQGRIDWFWAVTIIVTSSVLGDTVGYGLGRWLDQKFLDRYGQWLGLTATRRARVQSLFDRWGLLAMFITRTFMSYLSSIASLLAGFSRYRLSKFLATAFVGRLVWTAGYFRLGYGIGADREAATSFLTNLSIFILSLMVLAGSGVIAKGRIADLWEA